MRSYYFKLLHDRKTLLKFTFIYLCEIKYKLYLVHSLFFFLIIYTNKKLFLWKHKKTYFKLSFFLNVSFFIYNLFSFLFVFKCFHSNLG
jgi:hypothetical protein